jgi:hypothetical protein
MSTDTFDCLKTFVKSKRDQEKQCVFSVCLVCVCVCVLCVVCCVFEWTSEWTSEWVSENKKERVCEKDTARWLGSCFQHISIISLRIGGQSSGILGINPLSLCACMCVCVRVHNHKQEKSKTSINNKINQ